MCRGRVTISIDKSKGAIEVQLADAIVVGGGPAGSTCAWKLREAGLDVIVLDRAAFPRHKLCAGWVTPEVLSDLEVDSRDYPLGLMTFDKLHIHWKALTVKLKSPQHSIRRLEFDHFLLRRAGVRVLQHKVSKVQQDNGDHIIDGKYRARFLIGAGGTACPVYRTYFNGRNPRRSALQTATYEQEFAYRWEDPRCHLWFFDNGLPGYAWYVPKANGYVNVGLGGMADKLKQQGGHIREHWRMFVDKLRRKKLVSYDDYHPTGYSYYLRGDADVSAGNTYIVGDAAGLATRDMCEGIGPAVRTGLLAADAIIRGTEYSLAGLSELTGRGLASRILERKFGGNWV